MIQPVILIAAGLLLIVNARRLHAANMDSYEKRKHRLVWRMMPFGKTAITERGLRSIRATGLIFVVMGLILLLVIVIGEPAR